MKPILCALGIHGLLFPDGLRFVRRGRRDYHLICPKCGYDGGHVPESVIEGLPSFTGWNGEDA